MILLAYRRFLCYHIIQCIKPRTLLHVNQFTDTLQQEGGQGSLSNVIVKENESLDSALRRFKRNCAKAGIQQEIRKREHYEKPSVRRKKKSEAARKRKYN